MLLGYFKEDPTPWGTRALKRVSESYIKFEHFAQVLLFATALNPLRFSRFDLRGASNTQGSSIFGIILTDF
jgi:hypothetical protein